MKTTLILNEATRRSKAIIRAACREQKTAYPPPEGTPAHFTQAMLSDALAKFQELLKPAIRAENDGQIALVNGLINRAWEQFQAFTATLEAQMQEQIPTNAAAQSEAQG